MFSDNSLLSGKISQLDTSDSVGTVPQHGYQLSVTEELSKEGNPMDSSIFRSDKSIPEESETMTIKKMGEVYSDSLENSELTGISPTSYKIGNELSNKFTGLLNQKPEDILSKSASLSSNFIGIQTLNSNQGPSSSYNSLQDNTPEISASQITQAPVQLMPSMRKFSDVSDPSIIPFTPVDSENDVSSLIDGSVNPEDSSELLDKSINLENSMLEASPSIIPEIDESIPRTDVTLHSSLYGMTALSGDPPDIPEELLLIEININEALFSSGLPISSADITLFTNRVIAQYPDVNLKSFATKIARSNFFENIPNNPNYFFNILECIYQLENILFQTRFVLNPLYIVDIINGCNSIRNILNIVDSRSVASSAIKLGIRYLTLRLYNISQKDIIDILNEVQPLPGYLDQKVFSEIEKAIINDFEKKSQSVPFLFSYWRLILIEQLKLIHLEPQIHFEQLSNNSLGLFDILLEALYIDPMRMCPYVVAIIVYHLQPFPHQEIRLAISKIQTICLALLKDVGYAEGAILNSLIKPTSEGFEFLDIHISGLHSGYASLIYFHPSFPRSPQDFSWELCYKIFTSISMVLYSDNTKVISLSQICTAITNMQPSKLVRERLMSIINVPKQIMNKIINIQDESEFLKVLATRLDLKLNFIQDIFQKFVLGNPILYIKYFQNIFNNSVKHFIGLRGDSRYSTTLNNDRIPQISTNKLFKSIQKWSSIHSYFLSFSWSVPNSIEILGGFYKFTLSNCESLMFQVFRRSSYSIRGSIVDSLILCMSIYSVMYNQNISPVLIQNYSIDKLQNSLNIKIGTWIPTKIEWMRAIYVVLESRLRVIPSISNSQLLSNAISEDIFMCHFLISKYMHGLLLVDKFRKALEMQQIQYLVSDNTFIFSLCSNIFMGAHATKEEVIELILISTVVEAIRQFGFSPDFQKIREIIKQRKIEFAENKKSQGSIPEAGVILESITSYYPQKLRNVMLKALSENLGLQHQPPYYIRALSFLKQSLTQNGCSSHEVFDFSYLSPNESLEYSSISSSKFKYLVNSCLSWKNYGYFNLISCTMALVHANLCSTLQLALSTSVSVARQLNWPDELIYLVLSVDNILEKSNPTKLQMINFLKQYINTYHLSTFENIKQELLLVQRNLGHMEYELANPTQPDQIVELSLSENNFSEDSSQTQANVDLHIAMGLCSSISKSGIELWNHRVNFINKFQEYKVIKSVENKDQIPSVDSYIDNLDLLAAPPTFTSYNIQKLFSNLQIMKSLCFHKPQGAFICDINTNSGLPKLIVSNPNDIATLGTISIMIPPPGIQVQSSITLEVANPPSYASVWTKITPKGNLNLSIILSTTWKSDLIKYETLSTMYFPYSGFYIRLIPPVFRITINNIDSSVSKSGSNENIQLLEGSLSNLDRSLSGIGDKSLKNEISDSSKLLENFENKKEVSASLSSSSFYLYSPSPDSPHTSVEESTSVLSGSKSTVLPGIWHEHLGYITFKQVLDFIDILMKISNLKISVESVVLNVLWTLIASLVSFWSVNVSHCKLNWSVLYIYTGSLTIKKFLFQRLWQSILLNSKDVSKIKINAVEYIANFLQSKLSPTMVRLSDLGSADLKSQESCNDKDIILQMARNLASKIKNFENLVTNDIATTCQNIAQIEPKKVDCSKLAWGDEYRNYPEDLYEWPVIDTPIIAPETKIVKLNVTETMDSKSENSRIYTNNSPNSPIPLVQELSSPNSPIPLVQELSSPNSPIPLVQEPSSPNSPIPLVQESNTNNPYSPIPSVKDSSNQYTIFNVDDSSPNPLKTNNDNSPGVYGTSYQSLIESNQYSQSAVPDNSANIAKLTPQLTPPEVPSKSTEDLSKYFTNNALPSGEVQNYPEYTKIYKDKTIESDSIYSAEDLNDLVLAQVSTKDLLQLPIFPKLDIRLSEQNKYEIMQLQAAINPFALNLLKQLTLWSSEKSGKHPANVPNTSIKPYFLFIPPTPNNIPDSIPKLTKYFMIGEEVLLFTLQQLQRLELIEEKKISDISNVKISKANLAIMKSAQSLHNIHITGTSKTSVNPYTSPHQYAEVNIGLGTYVSSENKDISPVSGFNQGIDQAGHHINSPQNNFGTHILTSDEVTHPTYSTSNLSPDLKYDGSPNLPTSSGFEPSSFSYSEGIQSPVEQSPSSQNTM
ncbi:uncharacterized protein CMU_038190 [Cryptosporidium muris RN66]|uniref:Uncharacterized protein n=1 Tax=Cryptosporidium muris (strain RN66) TaxID=441375 RepID=B6A962_CRYMR|nr:uncharacterized protein CMU_038190 [Cryptosporidium muris RN66]EEA04753.1 hypothetical protein, conserved [Cryptosporidium muris RN66]|eukprot:XP_002139102.1 hypothetical protein [Cryptosporidium muris RN66]